MIGICLLHSSIQTITNKYFNLKKEIDDFIEDVYRQELDPKKRGDFDQFLESLTNDHDDDHSSDDEDYNDEDDDGWDENKSLAGRITNIVNENVKWTVVRRVNLENPMGMSQSELENEFWTRIIALGEEQQQALRKEGTVEVVNLLRSRLDKKLEIEGTLKQETSNPHDHRELTQISL